MRRGPLLSIALLVVAAILLAIFSLRDREPEGLQFRPVSFSELPGWADSLIVPTLPALTQSCRKILSLPENSRLPGSSIGGVAGDWTVGCNALLAAKTENGLRAALSGFFTPLEVSAAGNKEGVFTGYYETLLKGSRTQSARYHTALYLRPPELVMVDLGAFREDLKGRRIAGYVEGGRLRPYADRKAIDEGYLDGRDLELVWVDSAIDAFFLHIQGSGRVRMDDGSMLRVGYAGQNGHPYLAIGRPLIAEGYIKPEDMSMQAIRGWLRENPNEVTDLLHQNASFVFFRELSGEDGPYGSANVPLTAGYSLAVDRRHLPLHAPIWLASSYPDPNDRDGTPVPMNRLMVAQDTGGAIAGEIRGDVFWGFGEDAEEIAGRMANLGRYWLLLPKALAVRAVSPSGS